MPRSKTQLTANKKSWLLSAFILATAFGYCPALLADETAPGSTTSLPLPEKALSKAIYIFDNTRQNHYSHTSGSAEDQVLIDNATVSSETDCSGFVSFVVKSIARKHYETVVSFADGHRPRANSYAEFFAGLSPSQAQKGWLGVGSVTDLRPGDLIAWESPKFEEQHKGNSGHVMIAAASPGNIKEEQIAGVQYRYISVPVIDSSSVTHFPPEQLPPLAHQDHRDGVGKGNIRIILDSSNKPIGYWEGSYWGEGGKEIRKPSMTEKIYFARLVGLKE